LNNSYQIYTKLICILYLATIIDQSAIFSLTSFLLSEFFFFYELEQVLYFTAQAVKQ